MICFCVVEERQNFSQGFFYGAVILVEENFGGAESGSVGKCLAQAAAMGEDS